MCNICQLRDSGRWVDAVEELCRALQTNPEPHHLTALVLGRENLFLRSIVQRQQNGNVPTVQQTRECTQQLLDPQVLAGLLYWYGPLDTALLRQIPLLLTGLIKAQLSAVVFHEKAPGYRDEMFALWREAARAFEEAWPGIGFPVEYAWLSEIPGIVGEDLRNALDEFIACDSPRAVPYLVIRRIVTALLLSPPTLSSIDGKLKSAVSPALLYHPEIQGCVQHLVARRCDEGAAAWYPDPLSLAMIPLDAAFLESLANAWECTRSCRRENHKQSIRIELSERTVRTLAIQGGSLGATAAAVMQAVCLGDQLAEQVCIDAVLARRAPSLHGVKELEAKLIAAQAEGIQTVIVASEQDPEVKDIFRRNPKLQLTVHNEDLFGHAYDRLVASAPWVAASVPTLSPGPSGPLSSTPKADAGAQIGPHRKAKTLWKDRFGETCWAHLQGLESKPALLQVIPPQAKTQGASFAKDLTDVLNRVGPFSDSGEAFRATRVEKLPDRTHVIVYERPPEETADSWTPLSRFLDQRASSRGPQEPLVSLFELMYLGQEISHRLAGLHRNRLAHGELTLENVLLQEQDGRRLIWLKNDWVSHLPGFAQDTHPTDHNEISQLADALQQDLYDFGLILFQLACRRLPTEAELSTNANRVSDSSAIREAVASSCGRVWADRLPPSLCDVIRECLLPWPQLRPSADSIFRMLHLAISDPDLSLGFTELLHGLIQAGRRLFYVESEDLNALEQGMAQFVATPREVRLRSEAIPTEHVEYRLIVAEEERGLRGATNLPWIPEQDVFEEFLNEAALSGQDLDSVPPPTLDDVARFNAACMFAHLEKYHSQLKPGQIPIFLIRGIMERGPDWWDFGPVMRRHLIRISQQEVPAPVIIVAGRRVSLERDLKPFFVPLVYPPAPLSSVFTWIRTAGRRLDANFADETAVRLALDLYPCSKAKLDQELRFCGLKRGRIDDTLLSIRDQERKRTIERTGAARYFAPETLPALSLFGLPERSIPQALGFVIPGRKEIESWLENCRLVQQFGLPIPLKRIVLIEGPSGCGKNRLAECLTHGLGLPLVRLNVEACLKSDLGGTELTMANTLHALKDLRRAVVLISDADRALSGMPGDQSSTAGALSRVSALVQQWIGSPAAAEMILILTTKKISTAAESSLPSQWQLRVQWRLQLPEPVGAPLVGYREAVFAACFQARGLTDLACNRSLISQVAQQTDPVLGNVDGSTPGSVLAADARLSFAPRLQQRGMILQTPQDINAWMTETLMLHHAHGHPEVPAFWLDAVNGVIPDLTTLHKP